MSSTTVNFDKVAKAVENAYVAQYNLGRRQGYRQGLRRGVLASAALFTVLFMVALLAL